MTSQTHFNSDFAAAAQITVADVPLIAASGHSILVNNRPDDEDGVPASSTEIEAAALRHGLDYHYLPVSNADLFNAANLDAFELVLARADGPVFAHCRSGTRTSILWALLAARHHRVDAVLAAAESAGLDLDFLSDDLARQHDQGPAVRGPVPAALALEDAPLKAYTGDRQGERQACFT